MPKIGTPPPKPLVPFWATTDGKTAVCWHGDVLQTLRRMPAKSVQCTVTSPPYWGLRSYLDGDDPNKCAELGSEKLHDCNGWALGRNCAEQDWNGGCHVCRITLVMREIRRVLRDDGTLWLNYGDSYSAGGRIGVQPKQTMKGVENAEAVHPVNGGLPGGNLCMVPARVALSLQADGWILRQDIIWRKLSGMPESVRNRCSKSHEYVYLFVKKMGYFYDAEAIKTPMTPEQSEVCRRTVENARAKKRHEKLDSAGQDQVARIDRYADTTEAYAPTHSNKRSVWSADDETGLLVWLQKEHPNVLKHLLEVSSHKRSVWDVSNSGYPGAHFATFSPNLISPMILAGTSERGACARCGAPWERMISKTVVARQRPNGMGTDTRPKDETGKAAQQAGYVDVTTIRWQPTCECHGRFIKRRVTRTVARRPDDEDANDRDHSIKTNRNGKSSTTLDPGVQVEHLEEEHEVRVYESDMPLDEHPTQPCVVFDCFLGSGTTVATAIDLGRWGCGIELNAKYLRDNAVPRIEGVLLRRPSTRALTGKVPTASKLGRVK